MQRLRFFLQIVFLFLVACSSKDWSGADQEVVELSIRGDALHFSKGFSIALIEGAVPEKTIDGAQTTVRWKQGEVDLSLQFSGKSPEVKLVSNFDVSATELASISGRMMSDHTVVANFGGADFTLSQNLLRSPSGTGALYIKDVMQLHLPFLFSIQKGEKATRWRYVDDVELGCNISSGVSAGYLRLGLPRIDILHRDPKSSTQIVTLISAPDETDPATLKQKLNTIMNGHSQSTDPRFGNGGLAIVEGSATLLGKEGTGIANVSTISTQNPADCKSKGVSHLKGDPAILYFPGVGYIVRSEKGTSRVFRRSSLKKMQTSQLTSIAHLILDETLLIKEGEDWTLSERSALDFADLELFAENGKTEVLGATDYVKGLESSRKVSWNWSPKGLLVFECEGCASTPFLVKIENVTPINFATKPKSYRLDEDVHRWNFDEAKYTFSFEGFRPKGVHWRFQNEK